MSTPSVAGPQYDAGPRDGATRRPLFRRRESGGEPVTRGHAELVGPRTTEEDVREYALEGTRRILAERRRLVARRQAALYHLGGLAFELYRRDLLPRGVMCLRASAVAAIDDAVRAIDDRLGEIERLSADRRAATSPDLTVGCCVACRASFEPGARFCWRCGARVVPAPIVEDDQPTAVIGPVVRQ